MGESQAPAGGWRRTATALAACAAFALAVRALYRAEAARAAQVEAQRRATIERLVAGLEAPAWGERQRASRELAALGSASRRALESASRSPNLEVAARARELLERLKGRNATRGPVAVITPFNVDYGLDGEAILEAILDEPILDAQGRPLAVVLEEIEKLHELLFEAVPPIERAR